MSPKRFKKPERPRLRRNRRHGEQWLILEPARMGAVGGAVAALLLLLVTFARNLAGAAVGPPATLVGMALAFVAGYAAVGAFVWLVLAVAERELPAEASAKQTTRLEGRGNANGGSAAGEAGEAKPEGESKT